MLLHLLLPPELALLVFCALEAADLAQCTVCRALRDGRHGIELAWRACFEERWGRSLFALRSAASLAAAAQWRLLFSRRALAKRNDLLVVPGLWQVQGWTRDRRGLHQAHGEVSFAQDLILKGTCVHTFQEAGAELVSHTDATWSGGLAAHIVPNGRKRFWALRWRESVANVVGGYEYYSTTALRELHGGRMLTRGEFKYFGAVRGQFEFTFIRVTR